MRRRFTVVWRACLCACDGEGCMSGKPIATLNRSRPAISTLSPVRRLFGHVGGLECHRRISGRRAKRAGADSLSTRSPATRRPSIAGTPNAILGEDRRLEAIRRRRGVMFDIASMKLCYVDVVGYRNDAVFAAYRDAMKRSSRSIRKRRLHCDGALETMNRRGRRRRYPRPRPGRREYCAAADYRHDKGGELEGQSTLDIARIESLVRTDVRGTGQRKERYNVSRRILCYGGHSTSERSIAAMGLTTRREAGRKIPALFGPEIVAPDPVACRRGPCSLQARPMQFVQATPAGASGRCPRG